MSKKGENIYKRKDGRWEARYIKGHLPNGTAFTGIATAKPTAKPRKRSSVQRQSLL